MQKVSFWKLPSPDEISEACKSKCACVCVYVCVRAVGLTTVNGTMLHKHISSKKNALSLQIKSHRENRI